MAKGGQYAARTIRERQLEAIEEVERQLRTDAGHIEINGVLITREAAWAATQSIRSCWRRGLRYDGQWRDVNGLWWAQGEHMPSGALEPECIGRYHDA